jgi:hypothetical protein
MCVRIASAALLSELSLGAHSVMSSDSRDISYYSSPKKLEILRLGSE